MDDQAVVDAFDQLIARLGDGAPPGLDDLRGRTVRRRHRQVRRRAGFAAGVVLVLVAVGLAFALPGTDSSERVETQPGPATTTTAAPSPAAPDVLTIARPPDGFAFEACGAIDAEVPVVWCRWDQPHRLPTGDGLTLSIAYGGADPAMRSAWARRDAAAVTEAELGPLPGDRSPPAFVRLGGVDLVSLGVTEVVPGAALGFEDRVVRSYLLVIGDDVVQIGAEQISDAEVGDVVAQLGPEAPYRTLALGADVLPEGAELVLQAPRFRWLEPDEFDPSRSREAPGDRSGGLYRVPGSRGLLSIEVTRGPGVAALLDSLELTGGRRPTSATVDGHRAIRVPSGELIARGQAFEQGSPSIIVAAGADTIVQVSGAAGYEDQLEPIALAVIDRLD